MAIGSSNNRCLGFGVHAGTTATNMCCNASYGSSGSYNMLEHAAMNDG
ncbi:Hypotetical protein [Gulosibacter molinativorax]|nr:Hypotetical protein [Gulosibacter molinativorax]